MVPALETYYTGSGSKEMEIASKRIVLIDIDRSRRSRPFQKEEERLWRGDFDRLIEMIHDHVKNLEIHVREYKRDRGYLDTRGRDADRSWLDSAPNLSLAVFGPPGSGKSSLLKTLVYEAQKREKAKESKLGKIASLDILQPARFGPGDHLLYATVAASLDAHHQKEGESYDYEVVTPVLKAYRDLSNHLRVIHPEDFGGDLEPHALAAEVVQRHTSGLMLEGKLKAFFDALADNLTCERDSSVVLLPVDDLDLTPQHLLQGLRELQAYLLHPRLIPVFCFTDRLAEEILAGEFANIVSVADARRSRSGRLGVSDQLAVQYLSKCFPIRNRLRIGPIPAVLQRGDVKTRDEDSRDREPILLILAAASVLLFGVPDRNSRHPVPAAMRPSTLRRQFHVLDVMRQVKVDSLINQSIAELVHLPDPCKSNEPDKGKKSGESDEKAKEDKKEPPAWSVLFDRAAWALLNVHRDVLREYGMHLEDLYSWAPHALRRVLLDALFHLPANVQIGLWQRWRSLTDSRRSQVISLFAANSHRPWLPGEDASGEDHQQVMKDREEEPKGGMKIEAPLALLWFLDLTVGFYLPFSRSVYRQHRSSRKDSGNVARNPLSGAGWSFHSAPIHAALADDDDRQLIPTGTLFLDPFSYAAALTTTPRIAACRELDDASPITEDEWNLIKETKVAFLGTRTNEALEEGAQFLKGVRKKYSKLHPNVRKDHYINKAMGLYRKIAKWESGKEGTGSPGTSILNSVEAEGKGSLLKALETHDFDLAGEILTANPPSDKGSLSQLNTLISGLEAAATAVHDDQLLLRIWTCYGYNRGRFWAAVSLWRGLGLIGQLIESHRRWKGEYTVYSSRGGKQELEEFVAEKIVGALHTHSLRGLVPGKDLGQPDHKGTLELAFSGWNTRGQRQAIRRLAGRLESWLGHNDDLKIDPLQGREKLRWSECFVRRLHGASMVGALWQWLDAEALEHQGQQYGQRRRYYWNAGVALTSWIRVLQRYFERAHEIRWLLETCPLTAPFLSRTPNDHFLAKLREKPYHKMLECVQADWVGQLGGGMSPQRMREAARFRALTVVLQKLWEKDPEQKNLGSLVDLSTYEAGRPRSRRDWKQVAIQIIDTLIEGDLAAWKPYFISNSEDPDLEEDWYDRFVSVAEGVREAVWKDSGTDLKTECKRYQHSLLASFTPRVPSESRGQGDDEDDDELDSKSACFEIASIIQQHWKLAAHTSAASLFYQIPRVHRVDFVGGSERDPLEIRAPDGFKVSAPGVLKVELNR